MRASKLWPQIIGLALLTWLFSGCAMLRPEPTPVPTAVPLPTGAATASTAKPSVASGTITGRIHLAAPPTPRMVVYAVDKTTGSWATTKTDPADGEAPFTIAVPPGSYQVVGGVESGSSISLGYSVDGLALSTVAVAAGQTVPDIIVRPPSQSDCGSTFGLPASPDGIYAAVAGPKADCLAALKTPAATAPRPTTGAQATRIQFQPKATSWQTSGTLAPKTVLRYVLTALKGQPMTVELTTKPDSTTGLAASISVAGADGRALTTDPTTRYKGVLTASQDYYIEVRSLVSQNLTFTLLVAIPAVGSTPYVPVTPAVCQTLQELATQAIGATFTLENNAPFTDPITGETGRGCTLSAKGTGRNFANPGQVSAKLVSGFAGFTENGAYQADGPTGSATAVTRDLGLVLISAQWVPDPAAKCPSDKPIAACDLKPEQKLYTIKVQAAMK